MGEDDGERHHQKQKASQDDCIFYCPVGEVGWTALARDNRSCPQTSPASLPCSMAPNGVGGGGISRTGLWARAAFGEAATGWQSVISNGRLLQMILFLCLVDSGRLLLPRPRHVHAFAAGARPSKKGISTYYHRRNCTTVFFSIIYCSWRDILILSLSLKTQILFLFFSISCSSSIRNSNNSAYGIFWYLHTT